ncbi:MAG: tetratricopeptide repeat protein [Planctomycetes bacterium]|nr:tetratricopeptide repeat protein [Planctomycetota bacterium]MCW8134900.1 tetratricopeptide repeat protein [Planctomycetota bacterium]
MRLIAAAVIATVAAASLCAQTPTEALLTKTHKGAKENMVAGNWYGKLPDWVHSLTSKNQFIQTHLPIEFVDGKPRAMRAGVNKFEIRDANKKQFSAYIAVREGVDGQGRATWRTTGDYAWMDWKMWPAQYIVESYPVETNTDANDLVAMAVWLYSEKQNKLANRVLYEAHKKSSELSPLIQAYICEKEKWTLPDTGLVEWGEWDIEYQKERFILVTPEQRDKLASEREREAKKAYDELVALRGDFKGRPPRARPPRRQLIMLEWDIKQLKIAFQNTDYVKDEKRQAELQAILDSIKDDLAIIADQKKIANEKGAGGQPNDQKAKAEHLELTLKIDPSDLALRADVAAAWYAWAGVADHGNSCDRVQGVKNAIPHYDAILKEYPNNTAFLLQMGRCYQAMESSKEARKYYDRVIAIDGTKGNAITAKALIRNMDLKDQNRAKGSK